MPTMPIALRTRLNTILGRSVTTGETWVTTATDLAAKAEDLLAQVQRLTGENTILAQSNTSLTQANAALKTTNATLRSTNSALQVQLAVAQTQVASMQSDLLLAQQNATSATAQKDLLATQVTDLTGQVSSLQAQVASLQAQLETDKPEPEEPAVEPEEPARIAYGISTHTNFRTAIYGDDDKVLEATMAAKPTYLRDLLAFSFPGRDALWRRYIAAGVKGWHVTVGQYDETDSNKSKIREQLLLSADIIHEATGWNEPDGDKRPISVWLPKVVAWQKWLWENVKGDESTAHIKVGLGALQGKNPNGQAETQQMMEACEGTFEFVDLHVYPGETRDPKTVLAERIKWVNPDGGMAVPVVVSEYGGSTARLTKERQSYVITEGLKYLASVGSIGYVYELADDPDATGLDLQSNFGIYEEDWTPKPAALALREL